MWFKYLLLPNLEERSTLDDQGNFIPAYRTEFRYSTAFDQHARNTADAKPADVDRFHDIPRYCAKIPTEDQNRIQRLWKYCVYSLCRKRYTIPAQTQATLCRNPLKKTYTTPQQHFQTRKSITVQVEVSAGAVHQTHHTRPFRRIRKNTHQMLRRPASIADF